MTSLTLIIGLLAAPVVRADILIGTAKNAKGEIVYTERHEIKKDAKGSNESIRVEYKKADGRIFATMTSDFSKDKLLPETVFEDLRFKTKHVLRLRDGTVEFEEHKGEAGAGRKSVPRQGLMVASQGFDNFIRAHAPELAIAPRTFRFGVLSQMDFYTLTGYKRPSKSPDEVEYGIKASSWLIRLFADELRVVYDAKTLRLKSFAGRSNITDDRGRSQDVTIDYEWKEGP